MKLNKKNKLFYSVSGFIIGGIICGSIGVHASTYFSANQIKFTPTNESWKVDNAEAAMNDLYDSQRITISELNNSLSENQNTINSLNSDIANGKGLLANAITNKGVSTSSTATFETMASNINSLPESKTISTIGNLGGEFNYTFTNSGVIRVVLSISSSCSSNGHGNYATELYKNGVVMKNVTADCNMQNGHNTPNSSASSDELYTAAKGDVFTIKTSAYSLNTNASVSRGINGYYVVYN